MSTSISVVGLYAGLCVADLSAATEWYTRLLGQPPDDRPLDTMVQWRNLNGTGLQLWQEKGRAGQSVTTIVVTDLAAERTRLERVGIAIGPEQRGDFGAVAQLFDADGNRIALAEPPKDFKAR